MRGPSRRVTVVVTAIALLVVAVIAVVILVVRAAPRAPMRPLALSGDIAAHDPAIVVGSHGSPWFVFATGDDSHDGTIQIRESPDGHHWRFVGTVFDQKPAWLVDAVPGVGALWAPDVHRHGDTWYLYYAASTFGSNHSVIALATNTTLDPSAPGYRWVDRGPVIASETGGDFNAIDPNVVEDAAGHPWLAFGSFWSGIRMVRVRYPSGLRADAATPLRLANRGTAEDAIEAAFVVRHGGWYYLFASFDHCCQGVSSTYNIDVGRSRSVTGPYLDEAGHPMLDGGGTRLLASAGRYIGPGGESYSQGYLAYHYYDGAANGRFALGIRRVDWQDDGWPRLR
ncbi:arabinan endo-1,5-alpha-L-arabinosidase [Galbitalea soli]|uniref:Arabinan endo-1,5-alpha-L-arabinosidase n=1 Tax=Galbitalea soli TaxID=1268042 RepID=A0A7C9PP75_9MICO|nr:arabinan endo-1,5-alpha-L-arabinosidase [Galbitalea soli]NEM92145.1 arabinan endo-1,5-alpha-L-arabinosidase [Galbitalea soli]NYJ31902.1 arabinan endo-1,5-alpha-L-arabinosidase [Galbitalea soli]